jgi:hypothetical protein
MAGIFVDFVFYARSKDGIQVESDFAARESCERTIEK